MIDRRLPSFLVAGGLNTLFAYGVYSAFVLLGMIPHIALICSTGAGIAFNFLTTGTVFRSHDPRRLPRFIAVYGVLLLLNMGLLDIAIRAGVHPLVAQCFAVPIFAALTFIAMRRFVFTSPEKPTI